MTTKKNCIVCGKEFEPNKFNVSRQKYCSIKCQSQDRWRRNISKEGARDKKRERDRARFQLIKEGKWIRREKTAKVPKAQVIKNCLKCGREFISKVGIQRYCSQECRENSAYWKEARRKYYLKHQEEILKRNLNWREKNKGIINEINKSKNEKYHREYRNFIGRYKRDKACSICGYNEHPEILAFHHINPKEKEKEVSSIRNKTKALNEINKCILLCPNCHFWLHYRKDNKMELIKDELRKGLKKEYGEEKYKALEKDIERALIKLK